MMTSPTTAGVATTITTAAAATTTELMRTSLPTLVGVTTPTPAMVTAATS